MEDELDEISMGQKKGLDYLRAFHDGNGKPGLKSHIALAEASAVPQEICRVMSFEAPGGTDRGPGRALRAVPLAGGRRAAREHSRRDPARRADRRDGDRDPPQGRGGPEDPGPRRGHRARGLREGRPLRSVRPARDDGGRREEGEAQDGVDPRRHDARDGHARRGLRPAPHAARGGRSRRRPAPPRRSSSSRRTDASDPISSGAPKRGASRRASRR